MALLLGPPEVWRRERRLCFPIGGDRITGDEVALQVPAPEPGLTRRPRVAGVSCYRRRARAADRVIRSAIAYPTPSPVLPSPESPAASVPIKFPSSTLSDVPLPKILTPMPLLLVMVLAIQPRCRRPCYRMVAAVDQHAVARVVRDRVGREQVARPPRCRILEMPEPPLLLLALPQAEELPPMRLPVGPPELPPAIAMPSPVLSDIELAANRPLSFRCRKHNAEPLLPVMVLP